MAQYDGSIRINTAIETKGLKQDIAALQGKLKELGSGINQGMAGVAGKISAVENSIKRLASGMRREVSGMKSSVDGLSGSFKKLGAAIASVFAVRKIAGIANSFTELGSNLEEVQNVVDVTFTTMSDKVDEFAKAAARSAGLSETMAKRYVGTFGAMSKSFGFAEDAAFGMSTTLTQLAGDVASFYNISQDEAYTKLKSVFTGETETLKDLGVVMTENALNSYAMEKGIGKTVSKMTEQQKVALRYQFVLEKLSSASGDFVRTQDSWANQTRVLKLQLESLKSTIGQGLINVLNPLLKMLNTLLEKLKAVANAFKSFTESFFGKTSAGSSGAGYVDTSEDIAGSLEDVSDAAQDAEKALEGYLSPLDEINKYSTGKDKDLLPGLEDMDFGKLGDINMDVKITPDLDDSALSKKIAKMAQKVKSVLQRLFRPLKEAWEREGKSVMDAWKRALDEVWKTVKDMGRDFLDVWNQEKTIKILRNILGILSNIGRIAENLAHNFRKAWNENDRGKKILENIRDIMYKIVENIKKASDKTVEWADDLDFAPLLESFEKYTKSLIPLADALSGVLSDFYIKVLLPLGTWTIEKGLPELLDVLTKFNEKVDWESLRKNLAEFWEHLEPFAETVGEGLILFIERVSDALADFLNSQEFKDFLVTVEKWMDSVTPEDVADALTGIVEALIALKVALLGFSAISAVTGAFTTIKTFLGFIVGFGGLISQAAGLVVSGVSGIVAALGGILPTLSLVAAAVIGWKIGEWINENLLGVDTPSFFEMMDGIKSSFTDGSWKEALHLWGEDIKSAFKEVWGNVEKGWSKHWDYVTKGWEGMWQAVKRGWEQTTKWIEDAVETIKMTVESLKDSFNFWTGTAGGKLFGNGKSSSDTTYSMYTTTPTVHPAIAKLSNIEIPKLATGAVLPANREFLALVGDQKHGTNVEAPLDTIRQANREAVLGVLSELGITGNLGNGNPQTLIVKLVADGRELTDLVIRNGEVRQMSTGNNPFLLGTT